MFVKFIGITQDAAAAIERHRQRVDEPESDIIVRGLTSREPRPEPSRVHERPQTLDFGQGIALPIGERLYLCLSKTDADRGHIAAQAQVVADGVEMNGHVYGKHRGSYLQKPMQAVQERLGHRGGDGKLVSLSSFRQWHVRSGDKLVMLDDLKDETKRRHRRSGPFSHITLDDLGLA